MTNPDSSLDQVERAIVMDATLAPPPSPSELFWSFLRLGSVSFGGPAMVAHIGAMVVQRKRWMAEASFKSGVALCQAVPGAIAMQTVAYIGLRVRGLRGAVAAYVGFGLPAFVLMAALSAAYDRAHALPHVVSMFQGLRYVVVALMAQATWSFGRSFVRRWTDAGLAAIAAILFALVRSPVLGIAASCVLGAALYRGELASAEPSRLADRRRGWRPVAAVLVGALVLLGCLFVLDRRLALLGALAMKIDVLAFGGGFAAIPLISHEVVDVRGWIPSETFMDGIALGQVTPGPIVITATFVGYHVAGWIGAVVATVGIFLPSFFMVVLVEPWFERLQTARLFRGIVRGASLSFVGLLLAVTLQFGRAVTWTGPGGVLCGAALAALLLEVDVLWVVLAGAAVSALL